MTIHKIKKHQDQIPYEMVSRQVAQSVENPTALAIWLYQLTKPENWVVRRTDIKNHFGIGDVSYKNAVDDLERLGLYHKQTIKTENGRFADTLINIYSLPKINPIADNPNSDEPEAGEPVFPSVRITVSGTLKENEIIKENEITKDISVIDQLFEQFWLAGMVKVNKKKALTVFRAKIKNESDKEAFRTLLVDDVTYRLYMKQFGFDKMHPVTYLNGERWTDDHQTNSSPVNNSSQPDLSSTDWAGKKVFDPTYLER